MKVILGAWTLPKYPITSHNLNGLLAESSTPVRQLDCGHQGDMTPSEATCPSAFCCPTKHSIVMVSLQLMLNIGTKLILALLFCHVGASIIFYLEVTEHSLPLAILQVCMPRQGKLRFFSVLEVRKAVMQTSLTLS